MNRNHLKYQMSLTPNFKFFLEIGFCILFALSFFIYFNPIQNKKDEKALERLLELEQDVDELERVIMIPNHLQVVEWGRGATIRDVDGREYLDFSSGQMCATLGHNHPRVIQAIQEKCRRRS